MNLLRPPNSEQQIQIRKILNEDISRREDDLDTIKSWFYQQPHLPHQWAEKEDECILSFLRGCSFSLEKCKQKLDMYFTMRAMVPEIFSNRDISSSELQEILKLTNFAVLPDLTSDGKRVHIHACTKSNFETPDIATWYKLMLMVQDLLFKIDKFGVAGDIIIFDAGTIDLKKHFLNVSMATVKKFLVCIQKAYPLKIKQVHFMNVDPFINFIFNTCKPFLKEKLINRIHFHTTLESLHKFVPKNILPEEYGGSMGTMQTLKRSWVKQLEEFTPWFQEQEDMKADLSKRQKSLDNYEDLFGLYGSFRKLNVD